MTVATGKHGNKDVGNIVSTLHGKRRLPNHSTVLHCTKDNQFDLSQRTCTHRFLVMSVDRNNGKTPGNLYGQRDRRVAT